MYLRGEKPLRRGYQCLIDAFAGRFCFFEYANQCPSATFFRFHILSEGGYSTKKIVDRGEGSHKAKERCCEKNSCEGRRNKKHSYGCESDRFHDSGGFPGGG